MNFLYGLKESEKMKIKATLVGMIIFLLTDPCLFLINGKTNEYDYISYLENSSTEILEGKVISLESKYNDAKEIDMIYTFAEIKINKIYETTDLKSNTITVYYEGGTIEEKSYYVVRNPWGYVSLNMGDEVKIYTRKGETFNEYYYLLGVERIYSEEELLTLALPSKNIDEHQGCGFEYLGIYFTTYSNVKYKVRVDNIPTELAGKAWFQAITNSFKTWEDDGDSLIDFTYNGNTTGIIYTYNGINQIGFDHIEPLAWCVLTPTTGVPKVEFDIILDKSPSFSSWTVGQELWKFDVQNVATHEVGHTLCLEDLYKAQNVDNTMFQTCGTNEIKKRTLATGDKDGAEYITPKYARPSVTISSPYNNQQISPYTNMQVAATVSSSQGTISSVQFKVTERDSLSYDSGWITMTLQSGVYKGSWNSGSREGYYYVTVRTKSSYNIYGYDYKIVYLSGPI